MNLILAQAATMAGAATPSATTVCLVVGLLLSAGANAATILLAIGAFRKNKTEVSFGFEPASKEAFDKHEEKNADELRDVWTEINQMKHDVLDLTRATGEMSSKILADLANAKNLAGK
jgi:hypothetical protein